MKQNTSQRIVAELRARIKSGKLAPGSRVPSARTIMREHRVAIATASKVLAALKREGLVRAKPGVGTIVRGERGPDLTRERIVHAAIAIADDEGTARLSMRALASELGVATMSLYRYVASRDELLLWMADAVLAEEALPRRGRHGWRKQLEAIARLEWAGYRRHPWLAQTLSMTRPQLLKNGMQHTESVVAAIVELGGPDETTLRRGVTFLAYIRGMAVSLESELQAEQDSGMGSDEWMKEQEAIFARHLAKLPTLGRLANVPDVSMTIDALFECGLALMLDGFAAQGRTALQ